jgi:hypothetical protein
MAIEKDANMQMGVMFISVPDFREPAQNPDFLIDAFNDPSGRFRLVGRDIVVNIPKPLFGFGSPVYFRHNWIRCFISSLRFSLIRAKICGSSISSSFSRIS